MLVRRMVVVAYPGATVLDIACVMTAFTLANLLGPRSHCYETRLAATAGTTARCYEGVELSCQERLRLTRGPLDTLWVPGGPGHRRAVHDPVLVADVRRLAAQSRRVAALSSGTALLAAADVVSHRTHSSIGGAAGTRGRTRHDVHLPGSTGISGDLEIVLALVAEDHGTRLAQRVAGAMSATWLVPPLPVSGSPAPADPVDEVERHVHNNLTGDLRVSVLARRVGVSPRHLTRLFVTRRGTSPARYVRQVRLATAAHLLATTTLPVGRVAAHCGFGSTEALRQAFTGRYGTAPTQYRAARRTARRGPGVHTAVVAGRSRQSQ